MRLAVLFGSFARGTADARSDVDIAVSAPAVDVFSLARDLSEACGREVDVVTLDDPGVPLLSALVRDGVPIHEGRRGAYAEWRSRALSTLEIDLPWYHRMRDAWLSRVAGGR